jgi:hypothetical protein
MKIGAAGIGGNEEETLSRKNIIEEHRASI